MDSPPDDTTPHITWENVGIGFAFIAFDAILSRRFGLGVEISLVTSAVRCVVQLALMALVLQKVFEAQNVWGVAGMTLLLNVLGTIEVVINKAKMRFNHMFSIVLISFLFSTMPVSIIGAKYAMSIKPYWKPAQFIPIVGMLSGNTISSVVIVLNFVLKEIYDNRDKVEIQLAFGASRSEACQAVAKEALRLALTPPINQMSVIGIIYIPGMMTGALLGGASVQQAARLQMIIMFMIAAASALSSILVIVVALVTIADGDHRIRTDRIETGDHWVWKGRSYAWMLVKNATSKALSRLTQARKDRGTGEDGV